MTHHSTLSAEQLDTIRKLYGNEPVVRDLLAALDETRRERDALRSTHTESLLASIDALQAENAELRKERDEMLSRGYDELKPRNYDTTMKEHGVLLDCVRDFLRAAGIELEKGEK